MSTPWDFDKLSDIFSKSLEASEGSTVGFLGKYRLLREVGRGAMGVIFEAEDPEIGRRVALKVLKGTHGERDSLQRRFRKEVEAAAGISHPNVVRVFDAGEEQGRLFLVMEFVEGNPFNVALEKRTLKQPALLGVLHQAALGIAAAHAVGIIHRDIKPGNILLTPDGTPKIGDFGLAHFADSESRLTQSGAAVGTPAYMSPEQVRSDRAAVGPATDVYGLGAILYEILTRRTPHVGKDIADLYARIVNEEPQRPSMLSPVVPPQVETICLKALEKDPKARYPSAREFAEDLGRYLAGAPIEAVRPSRGARLGRWLWKHRVVAGLVASLLVVTVLLVSQSAERTRSIQNLMIQAERAARDHAELLQSLGRNRDLESGLAVALFANRVSRLADVKRNIASIQSQASRAEAEAVSGFRGVLLLDPRNEAARLGLGNFEKARNAWEAARRLIVPREEAGWWRLDEVAGSVSADASSTGNDGTLRNGVIISTETAPVRFPNSRSLSFDGVDDEVEIPFPPFAQLSGTFSWSFWARPSADRRPTPEEFIGGSGTTAQRYAIFPTMMDSMCPGDAGAGVSVGTNGIAVFEHAPNYLPSVLVYEAPISGWTHIAVVYVANRPTLYVNGVLIRIGAPSAYIVHPGSSIGGYPGLDYGHFAGLLDDVRLYGRALEGAEVASLAAGLLDPSGK